MASCLSAKAAGNRCEAGAIGAVVGEMWGDYQVDDPNTLTQAQKDKLINQAKLIAGITAVFAGEDVNVAAGVAEMSVKWNANNEILLEVERDMAWELANGDRDLYFKLLSTGYRLEIVANSLVDLHNQYNDITIMNLSMGVSGATIIINNKNGKVFRSVHPNINPIKQVLFLDQKQTSDLALSLVKIQPVILIKLLKVLHLVCRDAILFVLARQEQETAILFTLMD